MISSFKLSEAEIYQFHTVLNSGHFIFRKSKPYDLTNFLICKSIKLDYGCENTLINEIHSVTKITDAIIAIIIVPYMLNYIEIKENN
jgi:hypothetical protein